MVATMQEVARSAAKSRGCSIDTGYPVPATHETGAGPGRLTGDGRPGRS